MAQVSKYRYLLNQYPETVQKEQFRIICHISKRTARYLLQSGLVPCVQSGKKTPLQKELMDTFERLWQEKGGE